MAGPRATALRITWLYVAPDLGSQKVDRVQIGREMVVAEKSGPWIRVYANTDIQELSAERTPPCSAATRPRRPSPAGFRPRASSLKPPPTATRCMMGAAANQESLASDPRGPANAAQSARLLYRRLVEMFPNSPLAPEAAWRAADISGRLKRPTPPLVPPPSSKTPTCASRWTRTS